MLRVTVASLAAGSAIAACAAFGSQEAPTDSTDAAPAHERGRDAGDVGSSSDGAAHADAADAATGCPTKCAAWASCEGNACVDVAHDLDGLRFDMPCNSDNSPCALTGPSNPSDKTVTLTGTAGVSYDVVIRVRGVIEEKTYNNTNAGPATGTHSDFFVYGGTPKADTWNVYALRISDPAWTWYLNRGASGHQYSDIIDYNATIRAKTGAQIAVHVDSFDDFEAAENGPDNKSLQAPDLSPFRGQFVIFNLVSVAVAPAQ